MRCAIDAKLTFKIVSTRINHLLHWFAITSLLGNDDGMLFTAGRVYNKLVFKIPSERSWCEYSMLRIVGVREEFRVGQLLHAIRTPAIYQSIIGDSKRMAMATHHFDYFVWDRHFDWDSVSLLIERRHSRPVRS